MVAHWKDNGKLLHIAPVVVIGGVVIIPQSFHEVCSHFSVAFCEQSSLNQMSLPKHQGHQTPSAQYHQQFTGVTGDALCVTWELS